MSRLLKNLYRDVFEKPLREPGYLPWNLDYDSSKGARQSSPYQQGDIVRFLNGKVVCRAVVLAVFSEYLPRRDDWIPKYRVAVATQAGGWSKQWRYVYPGAIERAEEFETLAQEVAHAA